ncbi:class I SAM-dependent methyltransferase [Macrococcus sp. EM39E]|uniref:class I SAM-dependent methyltransferase n=1 Tax=Macrococcus animalis TaxID=3395467 RepID=UPI0039BE05A0
MTIARLHLRITTCVKPDALILKYLNDIVNDIKSYHDVTFEVINRSKLTIKNLFDNNSTPLLVIQQTGVVLYTSIDNKIFYHENTTRVKYKAYQSKDHVPPLVELIQDEKIETKIIIDATMGMANDLLLMAMTMPDSRFYAFEENFYIHFAIKWGIQFYYQELYDGILKTERIQFVYGNILNNISILKEAGIIYLDPMYEETVETSNIASLVKVVTHNIQDDRQLLNTIFEHFTGKVILRAHFKSRLIHEYQFIMNIRKQTKTHYGYRYNKILTK